MGLWGCRSPWNCCDAETHLAYILVVTSPLLEVAITSHSSGTADLYKASSSSKQPLVVFTIDLDACARQQREYRDKMCSEVRCWATGARCSPPDRLGQWASVTTATVLFTGKP